MIIYFSGTGNSEFLALELSKLTHQEAHFIVPDMAVASDVIIFVFPIYAWAIPPYVKRCMDSMVTTALHPRVYMCVTCGVDVGLAAIEFKDYAMKRGWIPVGAYSLQMPDSYVFLPGFDVDGEKETCQKLQAAPKRIQQIASKIIANSNNWEEDVNRGGFPWIKSHWLRAWFHHRAMNPDKFRVNEQCVKCGKCESVCPLGNISLSPTGSPTWDNNCAFCLRCYHSCPRHAIDYKHRAAHKGQYLFSNYVKQ